MSVSQNESTEIRLFKLLYAVNVESSLQPNLVLTLGPEVQLCCLLLLTWFETKLFGYNHITECDTYHQIHLITCTGPEVPWAVHYTLVRLRAPQRSNQVCGQ